MLHPTRTTPRRTAAFRLRDSVYALQDPATGLYFRVRGRRPQLVRLPQASHYPATRLGFEAATVDGAAQLREQQHDVVRLDVWTDRATA